jgi:hypothetical protein
MLLRKEEPPSSIIKERTISMAEELPKSIFSPIALNHFP